MFDNQNVFFESVWPYFIKLDKITGKKIWKLKMTDNLFDIEEVKSTKIYDIIERNDGSIFVLDKNTGEKLWKFNKTTNRQKLHWRVDNDVLIISDGGNKLYAYKLN